MGRIVVTAGTTRNPIDAARYIGAYSSGETGATLAAYLSAKHAVVVLGSPQACDRLGALPHERFTDTRDLERRMRSACPGAACIIHAAAVGDYEVIDPVGTKIPSRQEELVIRLRPAPNILDQVRAWAPGALLVSFKQAGPETTDLAGIARAQLERTGSDIVFANRTDDLARSCTIVTQDAVRAIPDRLEALRTLATMVLADLEVRMAGPELAGPG